MAIENILLIWNNLIKSPLTFIYAMSLSHMWEGKKKGILLELYVPILLLTLGYCSIKF